MALGRTGRAFPALETYLGGGYRSFRSALAAETARGVVEGLGVLDRGGWAALRGVVVCYGKQ
jgi:hypothetical protein